MLRGVVLGMSDLLIIHAAENLCGLKRRRRSRLLPALALSDTQHEHTCNSYGDRAEKHNQVVIVSCEFDDPAVDI
jgi:hypothetical protein